MLRGGIKKKARRAKQKLKAAKAAVLPAPAPREGQSGPVSLQNARIICDHWEFVFTLLQSEALRLLVENWAPQSVSKPFDALHTAVDIAEDEAKANGFAGMADELCNKMRGVVGLPPLPEGPYVKILKSTLAQIDAYAASDSRGSKILFGEQGTTEHFS